MERIESNTPLKDIRKTDANSNAMRTKLSIALTLLGISGLLTLSYLNDNIFMEYIAISGFIISCIAIIKLMETN